ncbi:hypothetical protein DYBT9275_00891 [Dyadobacter sp. CECT 9275]|uniref:Phage integrase SAM-like domain-containing protein n=1 Tax=Dyadobacter helix TaxID=2822344 RepID=A0A916N2X1_9BACT|nr:hypothetical protein [Dyadobacter sp. CECT 9275]CAG4992086.1 hypothetical protein DYBT9275_00891 [Dyadobacter sp. CECT 9275]
MKVLFWFRKSEAKSQTLNSDPVGTIQCRITIDNDETEIGSTQISCKKSCWDSTNQVILGKLQRIVRANQRLNDISSKLYRLYDILNTKYEFVTTPVVKEYYLSKRKFTYSIAEITAAFLEHRQKQADQKVITESTLSVNTNYTRHILDYCMLVKISKPTQIGATFFSDLFDFMIDDNRSQERFARKVTAFAKQVLKWGKRKGLCPQLTCFDEDLPGTADSEDYLDTTHLSIIQLDKLLRFDFNKLVKGNILTRESAETLGEERDAFVFNCFTGMHHCDYRDKKFQLEYYKEVLFLKGKRRKTKKPFVIKLLAPAVDILKRYGHELSKLPVKSNQKRNATLKLVALYAQIPLVLTTKIARKTFCDLALNEMMMTQDDVAACLGLSSTRYLKNYGRIREKRLLKVMKSWESLHQAAS